jgi:hypothetical protein
MINTKAPIAAPTKAIGPKDLVNTLIANLKAATPFKVTKFNASCSKAYPFNPTAVIKELDNIPILAIEVLFKEFINKGKAIDKAVTVESNLSPIPISSLFHVSTIPFIEVIAIAILLNP